MCRALIVLFSATIAAVCGAEGWWNPDWPVRQRVYVDASTFKSDLEQVPVTLRLPGSDQATAYRAVSSDGAELPLELVRADVAATELTVFLPKISTGHRGELFALYSGNPSASPQPETSIYGNGYAFVLHFADGLKDSTPNAIALSTSGNISIDQTARFDGNPAYVLAPESALKGIGETICVAIRFKTTGGETLQTLASGARVDPKDWFNFGIKSPNVVHTNTTSRGKDSGELNPSGISANEWHSAIVAYDAKAHTRTIAIDGRVLQRDTGLPGPLEIQELRIGRGVMHFESWQFVGEMDEVRLSTAPRSDDWLRFESGCLADVNPFIAVGLPQRVGEPEPAPAPFNLISPADGAEVRTRVATLQWEPSAGAEYYRIVLYGSSNSAGVETVLTSNGPGTAYELPHDVLARDKAIRWSVIAQSATGATTASEQRALTFYDWRETATEKPVNAIQPAMNAAKDSSIQLDGYLKQRIDRIIARWFLETPESSPAILQVMRDRDKEPVRDPLMPWAGEFAGKFLTAAEQTWRVTRDESLKTMIDGFAKDLIACQEKNGYLGPFPKSTRLTGGNWDVWGHYHVMLGLMLYYEDTGDETALTACKNMADLLFETFGPGGPSLTNDGSGGQMNMSVCHGLVLLYKATGVKRYLDLAMYIIDDAWNEAAAGQYLTHALKGTPIEQFPQHRWEALHGIQALAELYWLTGKEEYRTAFEHIWWSCVRGDRHNTGGFTSGEGMTGSPYNQGAIETCCTVAWSALSVDMLRMTADSRVADELEWSLLNSALGAIPHSGRTCAYNVPMDGTRLFGVELHWQAPRGGPDLNCCSVNAQRPIGMISDWGLMQDEKGLLLNYYGPSTFTGRLQSGNLVTLKQTTDYPVHGVVTIGVDVPKPEAFELALRIPGWSWNTALTVNGEAITGIVPGTYQRIARTWKAGDTIVLTLDFGVRTWAGDKECAGKVSVFRGPIVYAYDGRYNKLNPGELPVIEATHVNLEPLPYDGALAPWSLMKLNTWEGASYTVVDLSSAGQTGNHYRTWLPAKNATPSPFSIDRPVDGVCAQRVSWQAAAGAERYTVTMSQTLGDPWATNVETTTTDASNLNLTPGEWYIHVIANNANGFTRAANGPIKVTVK